MDANGKNPIDRKVHVGQGEAIKFGIDGGSPQEITCDDIARLALAMHEYSYFFLLRRGLSIRFIRDLNGSGTQGLSIVEKEDKADPQTLVDVIFSPTYKKDCEFLYEADLIMDCGKDYEPTINRGNHRFVAQWATIQIDWNSDEANQWRLDIERLSRSPETLTGWIADDLEMLVRCASRFCRKPTILTRDGLKQYVSMGLSLEDLKTRLKCSKCGMRGARVFVF